MHAAWTAPRYPVPITLIRIVAQSSDFAETRALTDLLAILQALLGGVAPFRIPVDLRGRLLILLPLGALRAHHRVARVARRGNVLVAVQCEQEFPGPIVSAPGVEELRRVPCGDDAVARLELIAGHGADDRRASAIGDNRRRFVVGLADKRILGGGNACPEHR